MENLESNTKIEQLKNEKDEYLKRAKSASMRSEMVEKQNDQKIEIQENLQKKKYLLTLYKMGDLMFSSGKFERQVLPSRSYAVCSLDEIPSYINHMKQSFWEHPDLLDDLSNSDDIPFEEKKWGIYRDIVISPMSEELEKGYIASDEDSNPTDEGSEDDFIIYKNDYENDGE